MVIDALTTHNNQPRGGLGRPQANAGPAQGAGR